MSNKKFADDLKPFDELKSDQKEFLIEHYKRCEAFWRHWTPTLWSLPSIAAAINVGTYSLIFDSSKNLGSITKVIVLFILAFLNFTLMIGVWKHVYLQKVFGDRILAIEEYTSIPTIKFAGLQKIISASQVYVICMLIIFTISLILLFYFIFDVFALICA